MLVLNDVKSLFKSVKWISPTIRGDREKENSKWEQVGERRRIDERDRVEIVSGEDPNHPISKDKVCLIQLESRYGKKILRFPNNNYHIYKILSF